MKKLIIYFLMLIPALVYGYTWNSYGPSGIIAYNICFNVGPQNYTVICTSNGICVSDGTGSLWNSYTSIGLPVWEAVPFDNSNILLVMGDSNSTSGIYKFNFVTNQFFLIKQVIYPTFIKYCTSNQMFYVGTVGGGLMSSPDGLNWNPVPYFGSQSVVSMDFFNNHFVVSEGFQLNPIYCSSDTGKTWNPGYGHYLTYIAFHPNGKLYGFVPISNSGSIRESSDFGQSWNVLYWSQFISTIGFDVLGNVMVGWKSPSPSWIDHGIAKYDTSLHSMVFYNEGLPNFNINKITFNPLLSSITLFCCTDSGVYFSHDYWTGMDKRNTLSGKITINNYPNPCSTQTNIEFDLPGNIGYPVKLSVYNYSGSIIKEEIYLSNDLKRPIIQLSTADFPPGVYFYRIQAGKYDITKKLMVAR